MYDVVGVSWLYNCLCSKVGKIRLTNAPASNEILVNTRLLVAMKESLGGDSGAFDLGKMNSKINLPYSTRDISEIV